MLVANVYYNLLFVAVTAVWTQGNVITKRHPSQVVGPVVGLIAVDVINRQSFLVAIDKGHCHKSMYEAGSVIPVATQNHTAVASMVYTGVHQSPLAFLGTSDASKVAHLIDAVVALDVAPNLLFHSRSVQIVEYRLRE